jgi:hypothetical protein
LSGIILNGIHKYFKLMFPVYGIRLTIFGPFGEHLCTGGTWRLRFEIVNIEIMQYVFVINNL